MRSAGDGGAPARRAVVRWAWRLFRREWRRQVLVMALLSVTVGAAILAVSAAYNIVPSRTAQFGAGDHRLRFAVSSPATLDAYLPAAEDWFGTIDVIGHRDVQVPGSVETVELRSQDPDGAYGAPMLRLVEGRYPTGPHEVALTDQVAAAITPAASGTITLDGAEWSVVGAVENPGDLGDEFGLLAPSPGFVPDGITVLVGGTEERVTSFPVALDPGPGSFESRVQRVAGVESAEAPRTTAALLGLTTTAVLLLLVGLVAAAGFVVVAQRRQRQLGMLAAIGATPRHLRLVMIANGVVVGVVAAVGGAALASIGWLAVGPQLEGVAVHRIDRFDVPWWLVGAGMLMAVVTATAAAWWPARVVARVPIVAALSARPPRPKRAHRSALLAGAFAVAGLTSLAQGVDVADDRATPLLVVFGIVALASGLLLAGLPALRALAAAGGRLPVAARLAVRDLARYQARSGTALAAISLGLGIAVLLLVLAAAAEYRPDEGNLSDGQVLVRLGDEEPLIPERTPAEIERLDADVDRMAATVHDPMVITLYAAVNPADAEGREGQAVQPAAVLGTAVGENTIRYVAMLYVATPELLTHLGIDSATIAPEAEVLTSHVGDLRYANATHPDDDAVAGCGRSCVPLDFDAIDTTAYASAPTSLITTVGLDRAGWEPSVAGWLIEASEPLTDAQLAAARDIAAGAGMTIEARNDQNELTAIRTAATAAGGLLALAILAMTVGLIRSESAPDLSTLTATGATSGTRRTVTATTAGALALLGGVLGTVTVYLALAAAYYPDLTDLAQVPVPHLLVIVLGVPAVAGTAGWLLAGREPAVLARSVIE